MVAVTGDGEVAWCIDRWEGTMEGHPGARDQHHEPPAVTQAVIHSRPGVLPTVGVTFGQAFVACSNTPMIDAQGREVGRKHLPTTQEWVDSADGTVGPGGLEFPYGHTYEPGRCAVLGGPQATGKEVFATGSHPDCVSPFGTLDQLGNVWEWADTTVRFNREAWLERGRSIGYDPRIEEDGTVRMRNPGSPRETGVLNCAGADGPATIRPDGLVVVTPLHRSRSMTNDGSACHGIFFWQHDYDGYHTERLEGAGLPVAAWPVPDGAPGELLLRWLPQMESAWLADKRGSAWYSGSGELRESALTHLHDFDGTIGVRCAGPPLR